MSKIIVIGCPGSGKSTFAKKLSIINKCTLYHLDNIWYKNDKTNISREEFDNNLNEIFLTDNWILDGNYQRTMEKRIKACDIVYFFDIPLEDCILGAENRIGKKREDLPFIENKLSIELKNKILDFNNNKLPDIYNLLDKYREEKKIIIFKSRKDADNYLASLKGTEGYDTI